MLVPAAPRAPARSASRLIVVLVDRASRSSRTRTGSTETPAGRPSRAAEQARAERRFTAEAARIAGHAVTRSLRRRLHVHGRRLRRGGCRVHPPPARVSRADDLPLAVPDRVRAPSRRRATTRRSRSPCSPTRPPTCAASATRPRRSATRSRRASALGRRLGLDAGDGARADASATRSRSLRRERRTARLPPSRGVPQRRLARPAAGRPELPVAPDGRRAGSASPARYVRRAPARAAAARARRSRRPPARRGPLPPERVASSTTLSRSLSRPPRTTKSAACARAPHSSISSSEGSRGRPAGLGEPRQLRDLAGDRPRFDRESLRLGPQGDLVASERRSRSRFRATPSAASAAATVARRTARSAAALRLLARPPASRRPPRAAARPRRAPRRASRLPRLRVTHALLGHARSRSGSASSASTNAALRPTRTSSTRRSSALDSVDPRRDVGVRRSSSRASARSSPERSLPSPQYRERHQRARPDNSRYCRVGAVPRRRRDATGLRLA